MRKRLFFLGAAAASAGAAIGFSRARTEFRTWGIDPADVAKSLPGDELVPEAEAVDTRSLDVAARPEQVWPWLVQMGYGRAGWYSWDQLDMNMPSADRIVPELQHLDVGDLVPTHPGGGFEVRVLEPERALVLYADRALIDAQAKTAAHGVDDASANVRATGLYLEKTMQTDFQASWAFVLEPTPGGGTRLIERFRGHMAPAPAVAGGEAKAPPKVAGTMLIFGLFVMVRRQLQGIRDRAEGRPISPSWFASMLPKVPRAPMAPPTPA